MSAIIPFPQHPFENRGGVTGACLICGLPASRHEHVLYSWEQVSEGWVDFFCRACGRYAKTTEKANCPHCFSLDYRPVGILLPPTPKQLPLVTLPPIAEATHWKIEFKWRDGETDLRGNPRPTGWFHVATYNNHRRAKNALRSLRYGQGHRKEFRMSATLFTHKGDIESHIPLPPEKPVPPPWANLPTDLPAADPEKMIPVSSLL